MAFELLLLFLSHGSVCAQTESLESGRSSPCPSSRRIGCAVTPTEVFHKSVGGNFSIRILSVIAKENKAEILNCVLCVYETLSETSAIVRSPCYEAKTGYILNSFSNNQGK